MRFGLDSARQGTHRHRRSEPPRTDPMPLRIDADGMPGTSPRKDRSDWTGASSGSPRERRVHPPRRPPPPTIPDKVPDDRSTLPPAPPLPEEVATTDEPMSNHEVLSFIAFFLPRLDIEFFLEDYVKYVYRTGTTRSFVAAAVLQWLRAPGVSRD